MNPSLVRYPEAREVREQISMALFWARVNRVPFSNFEARP